MPPQSRKARRLVPNPTPRNHTPKNNHPSQEHRPNNPEGENGQPSLTRTALLKVKQRSHKMVTPAIRFEILAVCVDVTCRAEELNSGLDDARYVEDSEDEAPYHDQSGKETSLID